MPAVAPPLVPNIYMGFLRFSNEYAKVADFTVTFALNGGLFTNAGAVAAVNFTLPTLAPNLLYGFHVVEDFSLTVTAAAINTISAFNTKTGSSVAFSTVGQKMGGQLVLHSNSLGTLWYVAVLAKNALTIA